MGSPAPADPFLVSWNITRRCNLGCGHCYLDSTELAGRGEATTGQALSYIDEIASVNPHAMLILTGGEPLLRPDIFELSSHAASRGLTVVLGTNGTLLDAGCVERLKESRVSGVGVSLDAASPGLHDSFRGLAGAWDATMKGIDALRDGTLDFQVQLTVTGRNKGEIPGIIRLARDKGARAVNIFFLVCTGRGSRMTDLTPSEYESILVLLAEAEEEHKEEIMVRARCAPHFLRVVEQRGQGGSLLRGATSGCIAGRGYMRVSPEGFVTPCPYIPVAEGSPRLGETGLREICREDPVFRSMNTPVLKGRCGECEFDEVCGGCRARALATSGDLMGEDTWCEYTPQKKKGTAEMGDKELVWEDSALENLKKVPVFVRPMVKKGIEKYARSNGIERITPEIMEEIRAKMGK
ncbi:MAG: radical SAM protein [Thermodesulfobacteriota bacterium]